MIMNNIKGENSIIKSGEIVLDNILKSINTPIKINYLNAQKILEESGMIEAYKQLIKNLCQNGMPEGNVYNYCSDFIKNFERVWQKMKYKKLSKQIEEHFKEKKELYIKNNENNTKNKYFRVLEQREEMQFIKKLDKSRSSLRVIKRINILDPNKNNNEATINNIMNKKLYKNYERKSINKIKPIENKNILTSNKLTFNIALKKNLNNEKQKEIFENSKIENIKENNKDKDNFKENKKLIQKMKNKFEIENKNINNKNNKEDKSMKKNKKAKKMEDNIS